MLAALLLITTFSCRNVFSASVGDHAYADRRSEILIRHLLRKNDGLALEKGESLNRCLAEQNALLKGKPIKRNPLAEAIAEGNSRLERLDRLIDGILDTQESIAIHNILHPDRKQAGVDDLLKEFCGDCSKQRADRAAQLLKEARSYHAP